MSLIGYVLTPQDLSTSSLELGLIHSPVILLDAKVENLVDSISEACACAVGHLCLLAHPAGAILPILQQKRNYYASRKAVQEPRTAQ